MANENGVWRTIGGRRIFIKEGQDLASAMKESGKFKSAKKFSKREELKKDIAHQVTEAEKNGNTAHAEIGKRELERLNNEEKNNQKWLTEKDEKWLREQGHKEELENKIKSFKPSGDIENDERRLEDISSNYFYDEVGIYNENIDSTATKWAHDKAVELNEKNQKVNSDREALRNTEKIKAVGDYENGAIDRDELLKRFDGNENQMKEAFEKMGYTAPTKENIDRANANARQRAEERKNATKGAGTTNQEKVLEEFKNSDGSKENFEKALNKISEMEYNNEINPDEYKDYISKIQNEYVEKRKKTNNDYKSERAKGVEEQDERIKKSYDEAKKMGMSNEDATRAALQKEKTTNDVMNEKIRSRGKSKVEEEDLPKRTEIKSQGTSNRKEVSENIQAHILDYYTEDYTGEDIPATEAFVRQMDAMGEPNMWKAGQRIAEGGSYLIYNGDMADFLDELKINPKGKTFSEDKAFDMYTSLIGRESAKLYDRIQKNSYKKYMKAHPLSKMSFEEFKDMNKK